MCVPLLWNLGLGVISSGSRLLATLRLGSLHHFFLLFDIVNFGLLLWCCLPGSAPLWSRGVYLVGVFLLDSLGASLFRSWSWSILNLLLLFDFLLLQGLLATDLLGCWSLVCTLAGLLLDSLAALLLRSGRLVFVVLIFGLSAALLLRLFCGVIVAVVILRLRLLSTTAEARLAWAVLVLVLKWSARIQRART